MIKVTKKEVIQTYPYVIKIGYCAAQNLLKAHAADMYTAGIYGWNADIVKIGDDTAIVTGYRPFGNIELPIDDVEKFDNDAAKIWYSDTGIDWNEKKAECDKLIAQFVKYAKERYFDKIEKSEER